MDRKSYELVIDDLLNIQIGYGKLPALILLKLFLNCFQY